MHPDLFTKENLFKLICIYKRLSNKPNLNDEELKLLDSLLFASSHWKSLKVELNYIDTLNIKNSHNLNDSNDFASNDFASNDFASNDFASNDSSNHSIKK